ncbi:PRTRC system protein A [Sulfobacillus thermosulfidooxidans DSM 9293]|uniref:PRTRC system protein A n=1 Tax=Sulfobacillus thermosulfidooxidans (strain DSM 9293 / VKM B-1269 / AT-1) TaxID=929705 RepID=A0A1W1WP56_SULTA|nr:Mov34/MPN/PAD-1 family protein [Sulfobacillus thermosulfidooxidans]SMC08091.1 PRTRC system protein A [Sulfobacillus thermosulfidooxidans DSM 9293]
MTPAWIGWYTDPAACAAGNEPVRFLITPTGVVEYRTTPIGLFRVARPDIPRPAISASVPLTAGTEGVTFTIPRIPYDFLPTIVTECRRALPHELLLEVRWDVRRQCFRILIPHQQATATSVTTDALRDPYDPLFPRVVQIHSHGTLPAFFSATDDADEQATGCYGVIGRCDQPRPDMVWRMSCGGRFVSLTVSNLFM